jgi:EamA domain-containing membrane protein RarD
LIKKAEAEFSLLFALEKPPGGLAYFGLKHRRLMMDKTLRRGSFEMTAAMLISGTIGWFVLVSGQPVLDVVFWRCVFGAATLLLICAAFGFLRPGILTSTTFLLAVLSGVAIVGNWVLLFASYSRASIAIGTAVYNVQPFMLVGLAALFLGEKITLQKLFWLGISFLGMLAIVSAHGGQGEGGNDYLMGIALALGAAFLYAIAALIIKRLTGTPPHLIAHRRAVARALCAFLGDTANAQCLGQPGDPGHRAHRFDVCVALRRDSKTADSSDRRTVVHLPDCSDFR